MTIAEIIERMIDAKIAIHAYQTMSGIGGTNEAIQLQVEILNQMRQLLAAKLEVVR